MAQSTLSRPSSAEMTETLRAELACFHRVGIAPRDRFEHAPFEFHPRRVMADFASIIAYSQGRTALPDPKTMGVFDQLLDVIASQDAAVTYLRQHGFQAELLLPADTRVSLPQIGAQAGIGEIGGVNSLFDEDSGLRAKLGAIVTDAPLIPSELQEGSCTQCWACVDVCPAAEEPFVMDPEKCNGCGECVAACPF